MAPSFLSVREVSRQYGISVSSVYAWVSQGRFPPPRKFGRTSRWASEELDTWLTQQPRGIERKEIARLRKAKSCRQC